MTWIKLDDKAPRHPKISSLTHRAFRWWVLALCYASEFLTDGILPPIFWRKTPKEVRKELTGNRLWDWVDPNFEIHDYHKHQSSKEEVEADKERSRINAKAYRDRRKSERRHPNVIDDASSQRQPPVIDESSTQIQIQRTDTDTEKNKSNVPPSPRPLISGESNPKMWGRIHGEHVTGFCDWVCLPEFVFAEFVRKSTGEAYVKLWASKVRSEWEGKTIGDNLKFWRDRWNESHPITKAESKPWSAAEAITKALAREAEAKAAKR